ncbi:hypothetical protein ACEVJK_11160 [Flintibacter sp. P01028]|uniref:hypothetical protein n=1 Tax=Flintibacter sp. P01028 TaxID=3342382 RepID=UPI0035B6AB87
MKVLSVVGDTPGWTYISEIFHEMLPASTREAIRHPELAAEKTKAALEPILLERFSHLDFDFCFCFRCLDRDSGWVSKARLYKNDDSHSWYTLNRVEQASRSLGMDIVIYKEDVIPIKNDKDAQKRLLGTEFWSFLQKTLPKYKKKIPMTDKDLELLLSILHDWLARQGWITEEGAQT